MNDVLQLKVESRKPKFEERIESSYVFFREGMAIKESFKFRHDGTGRILVHVGIDGMPVALQFIGGPQDVIFKDITESESKEAYLQLFGLACKMVAFHETHHLKLGSDLIEDALKAIKYIPSR